MLRTPVLAVALTLTLTSGFALAQASAPPGANGIVETKTASGYAVWFPVDTLGAPGDGPTATILASRPRGWRPPLVRPRLQFIPEMLKSVEAL
jgi:hypothetical protein